MPIFSSQNILYLAFHGGNEVCPGESEQVFEHLKWNHYWRNWNDAKKNCEENQNGSLFSKLDGTPSQLARLQGSVLYPNDSLLILP